MVEATAATPPLPSHPWRPRGGLWRAHAALPLPGSDVGGVVIGPVTQAPLGTLAETRPLGTSALKGKAASTAALELVALDDAAGRAGAGGSGR